MTDLAGLAALFTNGLIDAMRHLVSPLPHDFLEWLYKALQGLLSAQSSENVLTNVPLKWTAQNADVMLLWRNLLPVELGIGAIVLCIGGYRVAAGQDDIWHVCFKYGLLVILGGGMALWGPLVLGAVNGTADFIGASPADIRAEMMPNDVTLAFMTIVAFLFGVLAWIKGAVGVVFIDVLLVSAPIVLTLSALPMMEGLAKWWVEEATTWCLRPIMVALVLRLGLGIALVDQGGLQVIFAIVAFWIAYKMDTYLRRFSVGAWGSMANLGLFTRGATMAAGAFGAGPVAAPAAAAAAATP